MHRPTRFLSEHRSQRLIAWTLAMLVWIATALFAERAPVRRHVRQRYGLASLHALTRLVSDLAIIRAVEIIGVRRRGRQARHSAPAGFSRRTQPRALARAGIGARLRKAFKAGDLAARIQFLIAALADIDSFARRHLVPRLRRRLTKLYAIVAIAPPADPIRTASSACVFAPTCADTS